MRAYSLSHLTDPELLRGLASLVAQDRATTATLLAHIAEFDTRRLYLPAGYPSTFAYCVHELRLSEDAAYKRIQAARVARQFPVIFEALADGRLHFSAVGLLAPCLTPENADELLAAATHRTKAEVAELIARRFPRSETMALAVALPASPLQAEAQLAPGQVEFRPAELAPGRVPPRSKVSPVAPERYLLQLTMGRSMQEKLRYAQDLLGHALPSGDIARVLDRALDALIEKLERQKTVWNDRLAVVGSCRSRTRGTPVADRPPRSIAG